MTDYERRDDVDNVRYYGRSIELNKLLAENMNRIGKVVDAEAFSAQVSSDPSTSVEASLGYIQKELDRIKKLPDIFAIDKKRIYNYSTLEEKFTKNAGITVDEFKQRINKISASMNKMTELYAEYRRMEVVYSSDSDEVQQAKYLCRMYDGLISKKLDECIKAVEFLLDYVYKIQKVEKVYYSIFRSKEALDIVSVNEQSRALAKYEIKYSRHAIIIIAVILGMIGGFVFGFYQTTYGVDTVTLFELVCGFFIGLILGPIASGVLFLVIHIPWAIIYYPIACLCKYIAKVITTKNRMKAQNVFSEKLDSEYKVYLDGAATRNKSAACIERLFTYQNDNISRCVNIMHAGIRECTPFYGCMQEIYELKKYLYGAKSISEAKEMRNRELLQNKIRMEREAAEKAKRDAERRAREAKERQEKEFFKKLDEYVDRLERAQMKSAIATATSALEVVKSNNKLREAEEERRKILEDFIKDLDK